jgi:pSer/pThr/pTyr-binding forkhead associated (FHA) protein
MRLMGGLGWSIYLFLSKWIFIILIYVALLVILLSVRREMAMRLSSKEEESSPLAPGHLRVIQPGQGIRLRAGQVLNLALNSCLGCEPDNEIVLDDPYVSGHHARLNWDGVDWWIEDLDSRNGTFVGQDRLASNTPRRLQPGSVLRLGNVEFEMVE